MPLPVKKFRVGAIQLAVWENESKEGQKFFTISFERRYTDEKGEWHSTQSLKINDLPKAILAMQKAYEYALLKEPEIAGKENDDKTEAEPKKTSKN